MTKLSIMAPGLRERDEELVPLLGLLVLQLAWRRKDVQWWLEKINISLTKTKKKNTNQICSKVQSGLLSTKLVSCDLIRTPKHCSKALFVSSVSDLYIRVL